VGTPSGRDRLRHALRRGPRSESIPYRPITVMARCAEQAETSLEPLPPDRHIGGRVERERCPCGLPGRAEQHARAIVTFSKPAAPRSSCRKHRAAADVHRADTLRTGGAQGLALLGRDPGHPEGNEDHRRHDQGSGSDHAGEGPCGKARPDRDHRGSAIGVAGSTNMMKLHRVED